MSMPLCHVVCPQYAITDGQGRVNAVRLNGDVKESPVPYIVLPSSSPDNEAYAAPSTDGGNGASCQSDEEVTYRENAFCIGRPAERWLHLRRSGL